MDEAKAELIRGWLTKASHDLAAARVLGGGQDALLDVAIYHCQQAAEKALKGFLAASDRRPERTHDIGFLIERALTIEPGWGAWSDAGDRLTPYATAFRYPGLHEEPTRAEFEEAMVDAESIYRQVLALLPVDVQPRT